MKKLLPLQQWICDTCGTLIEEPSQGTLEWKRSGTSEQPRWWGFRIVHLPPFSPNQPSGNCYEHSDSLTKGLSEVLGEQGLVWLLSLLDEGRHLDPRNEGPRIESVREHVELSRRLLVPYYEQGRLVLDHLEEAGNLGQYSDGYLYTPRSLEQLVNTYLDELR